jgi:outer membrane protein assembly factor BamB
MAPTRITPANVGSMVRQQVTISAPIDAGLIYLRAVQVNGAARDVFFGTTNLGRTVAIDANDGKVLWEFAPPNFDEATAMVPQRGDPDGNPFNGAKQITNSSPVADANRQFIYAASADGKVHKISIADGKEVWSTAVTKLPKIEKMDSPLTFANGKVIVPTAGYVGDMGPYQGHVLVLNSSTGAIEHVWNSLCSDRLELLDPRSCQFKQSAIWGRAGIVIDPATGNLLFATGNGNYDGKTAWGDSLIMLDPTATKMLGNWTPANNAELNQRDLDVGSTSPVLLGDGYIAQGGKDGTIRLVTMDIIKGTEAHQGGELQVVEVPNKAQLLSASATAKINGTTYLYASVPGGRGGNTGGVTAWKFGADHKLAEAWKSTTGGNTPFVAGGMVFIYDPAAAGGHVRVFDAVTGNPVATLDAGGGHWNSLIVADNRIALPEGAISGFGGGGGGRGGGGRGGPGGAGAAPGGAPPAPAPPAPTAPAGNPAPIPNGIVNIWRLP